MRGIASGVSVHYHLLYVLLAMLATKYVHNIMFATILLFPIV